MNYYCDVKSLKYVVAITNRVYQFGFWKYIYTNHKILFLITKSIKTAYNYALLIFTQNTTLRIKKTYNNVFYFITFVD